MGLDSEEGGGVLKIRTPTCFIRDWIDTHYSKKLHSIGENHFEGVKKLCFLHKAKETVSFVH
jgi:chromosomal replication initiation ATPase DnaA